MFRRVRIGLFLGLLLVTAAPGHRRPDAAEPNRPASPDAFVRIGADRYFELEGRRWVPWGTNYLPPAVHAAPDAKTKKPAGPDIIGLEGYLESAPEKVEAALADMERRRYNTVRVFLQLKRWEPKFCGLDARLYFGFDRLLAGARRHHLRLLVTGLSRVENGGDVPDWFEGATDDRIVEGEACFWREFARRYRNEPAIFAYDLQNEPSIHWNNSSSFATGCLGDQCFIHLRQRQLTDGWSAWVHSIYPGEAALKKAWADYPKAGERWDQIFAPAPENKPGDARLWDFQRYREHLADQWVQKMLQAVRENDRNHLVTLGLVPSSIPMFRMNPWDYSGFDPRVVGRNLDFISEHMYPMMPGCMEDNAAWMESLLQYARVGKPLLIEEYYLYLGKFEGCPTGTPSVEDYYRIFLEHTKPLGAGWLGQYVTPDRFENPVAKNFVASMLDLSARYSVEMENLDLEAEGVRGLVSSRPATDRAKPGASMRVDRRKLLTSRKAQEAAWDEFLALRRKAPSVEIKVQGDGG